MYEELAYPWKRCLVMTSAFSRNTMISGYFHHSLIMHVHLCLLWMEMTLHVHLFICFCSSLFLYLVSLTFLMDAFVFL
jgi:hypothetical protein